MANQLVEFDILWDYNKPAETGIKFRELLAEAEKSGDVNYLAELQTQIARTEGLQMHFDQAHEILDSVEPMLTKTEARPKVRYLLERGRTFNSSKFPEKSRPLFLEAYELAKANGLDRLQVDAAHMMGIVEKAEESLRWNEIAMKDAEASNKPEARNWLGSLYNNTGWTYHDMGEYEKALALFEKNVIWHTEKKSKMQLIIAKWCVGRTLRSLGKVEEAYNKQLKLIHELQEMQLEQDGYIFEELGECLLLMNKAGDAKTYFKQAYELLSKDKWLAANETPRLERMRSLSE